MGNHFRRLDRIEASIAPCFPWEEVCSGCARQGLKETPYEHCDVRRCGALNGGLGLEITPEQEAAMRQAFEFSCIAKGTNYEEEMDRLAAEDSIKREAWSAKKRAMREARHG